MTGTPGSGNSKGVGRLKQKWPLWGGGGEAGYAYFPDYTIIIVKLFYSFIDFKLKETHKFISLHLTSLYSSKKKNKELDRLCLNLS